MKLLLTTLFVLSCYHTANALTCKVCKQYAATSDNETVLAVLAELRNQSNDMCKETPTDESVDTVACPEAPPEYRAVCGIASAGAKYPTDGADAVDIFVYHRGCYVQQEIGCQEIDAYKDQLAAALSGDDQSSDLDLTEVTGVMCSCPDDECNTEIARHPEEGTGVLHACRTCHQLEGSSDDKDIQAKLDELMQGGDSNSNCKDNADNSIPLVGCGVPPVGKTSVCGTFSLGAVLDVDDSQVGVGFYLRRCEVRDENATVGTCDDVSDDVATKLIEDKLGEEDVHDLKGKLCTCHGPDCNTGEAEEAKIPNGNGSDVTIPALLLTSLLMCVVHLLL